MVASVVLLLFVGFWERFRFWIRKSNLESILSIAVSSVEIREPSVPRVFFVVIDEFKVVEVELELSFVFLAFLFARVAISAGGARFELNVETESVSFRSFLITSCQLPNELTLFTDV